MKDWFEDLSQEEKEEIERGIDQANNNELINHEEIMDIFSKYKQNN